MGTTERFSVSVNKDRAAQLRQLVERGVYPSISSAFDAAADALIDREKAREDWWAETLRRCDEAEAHPERLLDADTFFRNVRKEIETLKQARPAK